MDAHGHESRIKKIENQRSRRRFSHSMALSESQLLNSFFTDFFQRFSRNGELEALFRLGPCFPSIDGA